MVAELALVGFLSRVAAPVDHQIALELEGFAAELAGLDLVVCVRRGGAIGWDRR